MADNVANLLLRITAEDDASDDLLRLAAALEALDGNDPEVDVDVDTDTARAQIAALERQLTSLDGKDVEVGVDVEAAGGRLRALQAELDSLHDRHVDVDVDIDRDGAARTAIGGLAGGLQALIPNLDAVGGSAGKSGGMFASLGASIGATSVKAGGASPAILAVAGAIGGDLVTALVVGVSGLVAMASSAVLAGGGLGALSLAGVAAAGALGGFLAGAMSIFSGESKIAGTAAWHLSNALGQLGTAFQMAIGPGAREMFKGLREAIAAIIPTIPQLRSGFLSIGQAFHTAFAGAGQAIAAMGPQINALLQGSATLVGPLVSAFTSLMQVILNIANAAMPFLRQAIEGISATFAGWAAGTSNATALRDVIAGLVSHLRSWWELAKAVGSVFLEFVTLAAPAGQQIVDWLTKGALELAKWMKSAEGSAQIKAFFAGIVPVFEQLVTFIARAAVLFVQWFQASAPLFSTLLSIANAIMGFLIPAFNTLMPIIQKVFSILGPLLFGTIGVAISLFNLFAAAVSLAASKIGLAWSNVGTLLSTVWNGILSAASTIWATISSVISTAASIAKDLAIAAWNLGSSILSTIWNGISSTASTIWNGMQTIIGTAASGAKDLAVGAWNEGSSLLSTIWNGISTAASTIWNGIQTAIQNPNTTGGALVRAIWTTTAGALGTIWNGIKTAAGDAWDGIKTIVSDAVKGALDFITGLAGDFYNAGKMIAQKVADGIRAGIAAVKSAAHDLAAAARSLLPGSEPKDRSSPLYGLSDAGRAIIKNLVAGMTGAGVKRALKTQLGAAFRAFEGRSLAWTAMESFARPSIVATPGSQAATMTNQNENNFFISTPGGFGPPDPRMLVSQIDTIMRNRGGLGR